MEKVIDITAKRDGFRRCGMAHSDTTQTWPLDTFTPKQIAELQAEPMLVVAIRNQDDTANSGGGQLDVLKQKVLQLEGDIQILVTQESTAKDEIATLTKDLETARQCVTDLTAALDTERQTSADLATQLAAATEKKGK
ncbi:hypothetical protein KGP17_05550 [Serratia sp. JSRIV001]|uniref:HI1506-related protein n=1 Tax=unclassified Serratia (in: enterobacteria) TaxID=2647522 RepID=UPI001CC01078|nr:MULTISPECIES: HI1506-related protein [unclassified Serratia (in: enterobacteria)]UAN47009.1 hypothetical protein KGP17_05550 [Serratia sp. JSRIV001]UAN55450.1 hypothetical protein KGP21_17285 [Serratia sp. JSRIV004]UAN57263.1 hypothetical protein KGP21_27310 [Serratia sp. JSRIV004]